MLNSGLLFVSETGFAEIVLSLVRTSRHWFANECPVVSYLNVLV